MQRDTFFAKEMELVLEDRSVSAFRGFTIQTERCMAKVASFARAWLDWQRLQCYARTWNVVRDRLTCGDRGITEWLEFFWDPIRHLLSSVKCRLTLCIVCGGCRDSLLTEDHKLRARVLASRTLWGDK